jgi:hypothetical protein
MQHGCNMARATAQHASTTTHLSSIFIYILYIYINIHYIYYIYHIYILYIYYILYIHITSYIHAYVIIHMYIRVNMYTHIHIHKHICNISICRWIQSGCPIGTRSRTSGVCIQGLSGDPAHLPPLYKRTCRIAYALKYLT